MEIVPSSSKSLAETGLCTDLVSAEERPRLTKANLTHGVLQVRVNLNLNGKINHRAQLKRVKLQHMQYKNKWFVLQIAVFSIISSGQSTPSLVKTTLSYFFCKLGCFNLHKRCTHSLQITALIVESDTSRTCTRIQSNGKSLILKQNMNVNLNQCCYNSTLQHRFPHEYASGITYGILVFVRVDASVHDPSKQVVHDAGQGLGIQHAMQSANKHRLTGVQTLGRAAHVVTVRDHPGNHLHLEQNTDELASFCFHVVKTSMLKSIGYNWGCADGSFLADHDL